MGQVVFILFIFGVCALFGAYNKKMQAEKKRLKKKAKKAKAELAAKEILAKTSGQ